MKEKNRLTLFLKWLKANRKETCAIEAKICKGPSLPFDSVKPHQETALRVASEGVMNYKIADIGFEQKPFDAVQLAGVPAYVVIFYYEKPGDKRTVMIPIKTWITEKENSLTTGARKSLTWERAREIGEVIEL